MTTTQNTTRTMSETLRPILHLRQGEKLGLGFSGDSDAMLSPAAALDDPQRQEKKEKRHAQEQYDRPRVHNSAGEIVHLVENGEGRKHLRFPGRARRNLSRENPQHKKGRA